VLVLVELLWTALSPNGGEGGGIQPAASLPPDFGSPAAIGRILYTTWLYPFEITSILLLVAVIGAVVLAKRKFA
jgi:NADH-quinone oxidoreductase subunit J